MTEPKYTPIDQSLLKDDHVRAYLDSDGEVGYEWNGVPILLLTTTGRKTGQARTSALIFARDDEDYLVVASQGGLPKHPQWYLNLQANPQVQVQVKNERFPATARTATETEKPRLWRIVTEQWPNYDVYQTRTDRIIPVVVLTPL